MKFYKLTFEQTTRLIQALKGIRYDGEEVDHFYDVVSGSIDGHGERCTYFVLKKCIGLGYEFEWVDTGPDNFSTTILDSSTICEELSLFQHDVVKPFLDEAQEIEPGEVHQRYVDYLAAMQKGGDA